MFRAARDEELLRSRVTHLRISAAQVEFHEEFVMYNLPAAALAAALPQLQALFRGWQPLAEPARGLAQLQRWRPLLESAAARDAIFQVRPCPF